MEQYESIVTVVASEAGAAIVGEPAQPTHTKGPCAEADKEAELPISYQPSPVWLPSWVTASLPLRVVVSEQDSPMPPEMTLPTTLVPGQVSEIRVSPEGQEKDQLVEDEPDGNA